MEEYGYMENGYLHSKQIEPAEIKYRDEKGEIQSRVVSIEEQVEQLGDSYKPVDAIDDMQLKTEDGYTIVLKPYDAGTHIAYEYKKVFDKQAVIAQINEMKTALSESDYKMTKCYEASLIGETLPYDVSSLHTERQSQRDEINELEKKLSIRKSDICLI